MRIITLSSYLRDCLNAAADARRTRHGAALVVYQQTLSERQDRINQACSGAVDALRHWRPILAIRLGFLAWQNAKVPVPDPPPPPPLGDDEHRLLAGAQGEMAVAAYLGQRLDDKWTLICGYTNRGGELDQLLIGPAGLFAIEVKHVNGVIEIHGERWERKLRTRKGMVGRPIADGGGRSPSQQVNATADVLQTVIARILTGVHVERFVVLSHQRACVAELIEPTTHVVMLGRWRLDVSLGLWHRSLSATQCHALVEAVCRHHDQHRSCHARAA